MQTNGLYNSSYEHDACGVGMVVNIHGGKSHQLVDDALKVLENLRHRGAEGADGKTGDGAGILLQIPHEFILLQGIPVPEKGKYGTGLIFLPKDEKRQQEILSIMIEEIEREGLQLMHLRTVPTNPDCLGEAAAESEPAIKQVFITGVPDDKVPIFDRMLYLIRKRIERRIQDKDFYICSLSSKNIVYKGMLSSLQLRQYYPDLTNSYFTSGLALVHSRFSTNTFPTWSLAQPFRLLAHNGEINTIRGNRSWMKAREAVLSSEALGDIHDISPIIQPNMSDSASLDNVFEFFVMNGMSLPKALSIMVPESFNDKNPISEDIKAFYEYHSILMEPWDGPAALLFSDGRFAGGMLDRNGLRPARYTITKTGTMVVASEVGVMDFDPTVIAEKGRLQPGKILLIDTKEGKIYYDGEIKDQLAHEHPYHQWLNTNRIQLEKIHTGRKVSNAVEDLEAKEMGFGFGEEDISDTLIPMAIKGQEPTASMGNDTPLAVLSDQPQIFFNYFRQQFAQVTNPAIDSIREQLVMSLAEYIGRVGTGILNPNETNCKMVRLPHPILTNSQLDILQNIRYKGFNTRKLSITFKPAAADAEHPGEALREAIDKLCHDAEQSVDDGFNYIILSDRDVDNDHVAIPSLLAVSAVHHYLINVGKRVQTALIVESGEIREVMHAALLLGYGASALCPYMVYAILDDLVKKRKIQENYATAEANYINAVKKGLLKIMAKMGISTIRSYRGAQIFEAIGLSEGLLRTYFGTETSTVGGIGLDTIARDAEAYHKRAIKKEHSNVESPLPNLGQFHWRYNGIKHAWNPETIATLQLATRTGNYETFKKFENLVDNKPEPLFLRDFLDWKRSPIDIEKVEPVEKIVKHFVTGAMSFGALSAEAHEALCLAMNALGTRSNTGEGGEDNSRYHTEVDGISLSSKTKQVASGRFGVTTEYLVNAEEIQIKVAQGAKPGEGGQLPGFKVNEIIAKTRNSIPGISLISPPPHHDIYSIEDLKQLIFDLKNVNPKAAISVKLVAESGVGTIAAGVVKAKADLVVISGAEGGTGASPASSMRFAGISPEIGVAETQQTLVKNGLRSLTRLQVDGQMKSARDVIIMALLGAEEFGFGTAPLITLGCVMMRKCSSNTCPMGVATQDERLRKHFRGDYHYVINYFTFLAQHVREYLAEMGFTTLNDIVGHTELLIKRDTSKIWAPVLPQVKAKWDSLDFTCMERKETGDTSLYCTKTQDHELTNLLDQQIIAGAQKSIQDKEEVNLDFAIHNTNRAVGAMLSGIVAEKYGEEGLPGDTINVRFKGSAGQSFGAFLIRGVNFKLEGETNDYFAKGLSGGRISILPPIRSNFNAEDNIIAGNTGLYGATTGELYVNGKVGERFAVRNSGAIAVVEGAGDHCCEYMTGGRVVVLGKTGRNFAAGMSGGVAYVWDKDHNFDYYCNMGMVEINLVEETTYRKELHELIRQHYLYTGSKLARTMLDDWNRYIEDFIQVVPIEYKRVLQEEQVKKLQQKISDIQRDY
ncbi:glutamate synthase [Hallella multisaccharivorax DSM 17128]|uniref:Glutamate synthase [NADPH] large chain n=1 Tax=Hallella multisaccharivorax DSM 17128 TaxID=688246 RepID=F8N866_9BACT|nr:glutamate synthase large subunit [Hallella multisaccharivorax]EGN56504.1 glutamate synthase (NADH) large subunit [Hallella multisaccharivorax DSM 17128]GJG30036.1 glutamate synthase [Hallella multisaccharivorax DSM 17128]